MVAERKSKSLDSTPAMAFSGRVAQSHPSLAEELMEAVDGDLTAVQGIEQPIGGLLA